MQILNSIHASLSDAINHPHFKTFQKKCASLKDQYEEIDSNYTRMIIVASFVAINQLALLDTLGSFACFTLASKYLKKDPVSVAIKNSTAPYITDENTRNIVVETALVVLALSVTRLVVSQILDTKVKPLGFKQTGRTLLASFIMWNAVNLYKQRNERTAAPAPAPAPAAAPGLGDHERTAAPAPAPAPAAAPGLGDH